MAECCFTEHYRNLQEHFTTSLTALADCPVWTEAWELGVRWASP